MARYPQGASVRLTATIRDATNALVNANSTLITVRHAATTTTYTSPTNDSVGLYHLDLPAADVTAADHYSWVWDATIGTFHALVTGSFDVFDPLEVAVLSLADAKDSLNIPQATTTDDAEIARMIASIEANLELMTSGPILNTACTDRVDMDGQPWEIVLTNRPLVSVTSITDVATGQPVDISALDIDSNAAMIHRKDGQQFFTNTGVVSVVYVAGWGTAVPPAIGAAAGIILQGLWQSQHGPPVGPSFGGLDPGLMTPPTLVSAYPLRALELLAPYLRSTGFA